ncbi:MAG: DNA polymerase III subunit gamma/tau, partial [Elusimicrobiales bacterium]|nr:DNA polymerase III subunit gamma/tau [Elusimicrobiales bacterium]
MYENFATKYRPQTFEDVKGQDAVIKTLTNSLKMKRVAHAYLFFGPRGCGKTSVARIFAKALNCHKPQNFQPCNKCASCKEITESKSLDVLEIDAASHTKVEQIRDTIVESVDITPSRDKYKIYILDEVHMLSKASFNALLKTIEEPPEHVIFIMATTEQTKVLPTIISRCQSFRF